MKSKIVKFISLFLVIVFMTGTGILSSAASESSYKADFTVSVSKTSLSSGDTVKVSVGLKTNYGIYAMSLPVIYDADKFEMQNTSSSNVSSFLTFEGRLASAYNTNGNWKSPSSLYSRNSNSDYWTQSAVMNKYKIAYATWAADSSKSKTPVTLSSSETVVSFTLKAKKDIKAISSSDIFISKDFLKTESCPGGILFVGRCVGSSISAADFVPYGQTINISYSYSSSSQTSPVKISVNLDYKGNVDLMEYLDGFSKDKCSFVSSDENVVKVENSTASAVGRGNACVSVKDSSSGKTAEIDITVKYSWWQWIIVILLFGWAWY